MTALAGLAASCSGGTPPAADGSTDAPRDAGVDAPAGDGARSVLEGGMTEPDASLGDPDAGPSDTFDGTHHFDLADHMPGSLAMMYSMSWFGIPSTDPDGAGSDPSWGNWRWGGGCVPTNDPGACETVAGASPQRDVASKRYPLAGIYSASGRDEESRRRTDLMLSVLRRPCDPGALVDAWAVQLDTVRFTSRHLDEGDPNYSTSGDTAYRALLTFYDRADAAGMNGVVVAADDTSWYWHFGDRFGLATQADRLAALTDDIVDMVAVAAGHRSALRLNGKLLFYFWLSGVGSTPYVTVDEWRAVLLDARTRSGVDFYAVGASMNAAFFGEFDALAPWIQLSIWQSTSGATLRDHALAWTERRHAPLISALPTYPGRVVWAGITPGFDDYTRNWGACADRAVPRDPALLDGQFDWLDARRADGDAIGGMILETWDDWTEGSELEPDVLDGTAKLEQLRGRLAGAFGTTLDPTDTRMEDRWQSYGQARNCDGTAAVPGPAIDLTCP